MPSAQRDPTVRRLGSPLRGMDAALARAAAAVEVRRRRARRDYNSFVEFALRDERGHALTQDVIHRVWQLHIRLCWEAGVHPAIIAPFAHGKTVQLVTGRSAYEIGLDPNIRIKVVCNSDTKSKERVAHVGNILQSQAYRAVFPHVRPVPPERAKKLRPKWTEHMLLVDRVGSSVDVTVQAHGVTSTGVGGRADLIVFDDVCDRKNSIDEPATRSRIVDGFDDTWMSRLSPRGRVIYVGTPWHQADLTHHLMGRPGWSVLRMPLAADLSCIECEIFNPPANYPREMFAAAA